MTVFETVIVGAIVFVLALCVLALVVGILLTALAILLSGR